jgi:class 3 adenylate cyclase
VERLEIKKAMKRKSRPRFYLWLVVLAGVILAVTLAVSSLKIIRGGKNFIKMINEENKTFVVNTVRFGHGVMMHMGSETYDSLIDLALKSNFIQFLAILDEKGNIIAQSDPPSGIHLLKSYDVMNLEDGKILEKIKRINLISYKAQPELVPTEEHMRHHSTMMSNSDMMGKHAGAPKPGWFLVGMDTSLFNRHYRDMVIQTFGTGAAFLLLGLLIIVYTGIIQRYELAHLSIERLQKIRRVMGYFIPSTAKSIIEKEPEKKGLLDKYIQDASILFLDIEGFSLFQQDYPQEKINRTIEYYFSIFLNLIQKNGGDINETAGDGMMVIFLDSNPAQHARNAVRAALEIQEESLKTHKDRALDLFDIRVNIGVHTGKVYLGSTKMIGSEEERWTFTASGEVTIMAARLSQYAKEGRILLGEETARRVEKDFSLNSIGKIPLKNIKDSGEIYEISSVSA